MDIDLGDQGQALMIGEFSKAHHFIGHRWFLDCAWIFHSDPAGEFSKPIQRQLSA